MYQNWFGGPALPDHLGEPAALPRPSRCIWGGAGDEKGGINETRGKFGGHGEKGSGRKRREGGGKKREGKERGLHPCSM